MNKVLKILGFVVGGLVVLVLLAVGGLYAATSSALKKTVESPAHGFSAPRDSAAVARGAHLVRTVAKCADCHGENLGGTLMIDEPVFARLVAANLTTGAGGVLGNYTDEQLEVAIRHGVAPDGRRLVVMPAQEFQHLSDQDLGDVIAYIRAQPPVDNELGASTFGPISRALFLSGQLPLFSYDSVRHGREVVAAVPVDTTVAYGRYLGDIGCQGCHGPGYGGGKIPGTPPEFPPVSNITPTGIGHYTYEGYVTVMRTGIRPDGSKLHEFFPLKATQGMTDVELRATWNYLRTLPPKEFGTR